MIAWLKAPGASRDTRVAASSTIRRRTTTLVTSSRIRKGSRVLRQGRSRRFAAYQASNRLRTSVGEGSPIGRTIRGGLHQRFGSRGGDPPRQINLKQG